MSIRLIKKPLFLIPVIMAVAIGLVSILAWVALKPINEKAGFKRTFIAKDIKMLNVIDKPKDVLDFAGATDNHIYFKTKDPARLYVTDIQLQNGKYLKLNVPNNEGIASQFNCIVDSPFVYVLVGNIPAILKTEVGDTRFSIYKFPDAIFTRAALMLHNSFAVRMFTGTDQIFAKGNPATGTLEKEKNISEKNKDAGISTDGLLLYDIESNSLLYIHFYKNEILRMDTNLNLISKMKTIDPINSSSVKAEEVNKKDIITSLTPKRLINASASVSKGWLFNNSIIKADNENSGSFINNSVIDMYDINSGLFKGSFYVPKYKQERMIRFNIICDGIVVMYKDHLISYKIPVF